MAQPAIQPPPHLQQVQEAQRQALFQAAARVTRHHVQKFEQQLSAQVGAQPGGAEAHPPRKAAASA